MVIPAILLSKISVMIFNTIPCYDAGFHSFFGIDLSTNSTISFDLFEVFGSRRSNSIIIFYLSS